MSLSEEEDPAADAVRPATSPEIIRSYRACLGSEII